MDIKAYIQSGVIEQYVLGLASPEEAAELFVLRKQYPELDEAISEFELLHERKMMENTMQPPSFLKDAIEKQLFGESDSKTIVAAMPQQQPSAIPQQTVRIINPVWKYLAAASIILLIVSTALNFYFYSGYQKTKNQYQALLTERNTLQANNASYKQSLQLFQDTTITKVDMKGLPGKEQNLAIVLWDKKSKDVYINMNGMQQTPAGKQYQLWAIVDDKPVSLGMLSNCGELLCKMNNVDKPQAFAITLEKEGGSPTPTMDQMYVMGKI